MALGKAMGPGGKIARAEKKVDKAKEKVSKAAKNLISSRDTPSEYDRKRAIQGKTEAKVSKAVAKVDKAKGKLTTATRKVAEKAEAKYDKGRAAKKGETAMDMINRQIGQLQRQDPLSGPFKQAVKQKTFKRK